MSKLILPPTNIPQPTLTLVSLCHTCRRRHEDHDVPAVDLLLFMDRWRQKHYGHELQYYTPHRRFLQGHRPSAFRRMMQWFDRVWAKYGTAPWWMEYAPNANFQVAYESSAALTIGLGSLASDATLLAGRESTAISNTSVKDMDYLLAGFTTVGTTPTANTKHEYWLYGSQNDTPAYPNVIDGTDSAETMGNAEIKKAGLRLFTVVDVVATTSDLAYPYGPSCISRCFGGVVPKNWGMFFTHNNVAALNATAGNHVHSYTGAYVSG